MPAVLSKAHRLSAKTVIVLTDFEPDDRTSIAVLEMLHGDQAEIVYVTALRDPTVSADLLKKQLAGKDRLVMPGHARIKADWQDPAGKFVMTPDPTPERLFVQMMKDAAAKESNEEKRKAKQELITSVEDRIFAEAQARTHEKLIEIFDKAAPQSIAIFLLTVATDLMAIKDRIDPSKISAIYAQGGDLPGKRERSDSLFEQHPIGFNWISDMKATKELLAWHQLHKIPMYLITNNELSKVEDGKPAAFPGGSLSAVKFPEVIAALKTSKSLVVQDIMGHAGGWDRQLRVKLPVVAARIGEASLENQLCPCDVAVVAMALQSEICVKPVRYAFTADDKETVCTEADGSYLNLVCNITPDATVDTLLALATSA